MPAFNADENESTDIGSKVTTEAPSIDENNSKSGENYTEVDSEKETEAKTVPEKDIVLEGINADSIKLAYELKNGVNGYFANTNSNDFVIENQNMTLNYQLAHYNDQTATHLSNKSGNAYI